MFSRRDRRSGPRKSWCFVLMGAFGLGGGAFIRLASNVDGERRVGTSEESLDGFEQPMNR